MSSVILRVTAALARLQFCRARRFAWWTFRDFRTSEPPSDAMLPVLPLRVRPTPSVLPDVPVQPIGFVCSVSHSHAMHSTAVRCFNLGCNVRLFAQSAIGPNFVHLPNEVCLLHWSFEDTETRLAC